MSAAEFVREFHEVYGCPARQTPALDVPEAPMRLALIDEEVAELHDAIEAGDLIEVADALADIAYVVYGAALTFGIDLDAVLAEVHRSNMSKLGADGRPIYRADGKILKGPGYFRPDVASVLGKAPEARSEAHCWLDVGCIRGYHGVMDEDGCQYGALAGPGAPAGVEVAPGATDDMEGPQNGCAHEWTKRGNRADPWVMCWLCSEVRNGWTDEQRRGDHR